MWKCCHSSPRRIVVPSIVQSDNNVARILMRTITTTTTTTLGSRRAVPRCSNPQPLSRSFTLYRNQGHQNQQQLQKATFSTDSNDSDKNHDNNINKSSDEDIGNFAMPNMDVELKLAKLQTSISQHYQQGDYVKALQLSTELFQQTQKHFCGSGSGRPQQEHPAVASALNNIGLMHKQLGDFIESRRHYNAALRIYAKVVGRDHASYAMTLHNLASLNKAQVHFDTSLKATDRLSLVEKALEYFEEALAIRRAELGPDHPLTIATQSSLGTTLADQVVHQHRQVEMVKNGQQSPQQQQLLPKRYMASLHPESVTQQGWDAAEYHLRQALQMAIDKPRGKSILHGNHNNNNPKSRTNSKKAKKKTSSHGSSSNDDKDSTSTVEGASGGGVHTLSAASAAQNLAIFLKSRAMTQDPYHMDRMEEARLLYQQVLNVRSQLLPNPHQHPDVVATKFSLAELLHVLGDEEAANAIRQEILDDYDPVEERQGEESSSSSLDASKPLRKVVVERTQAVTK